MGLQIKTWDLSNKGYLVMFMELVYEDFLK